MPDRRAPEGDRSRRGSVAVIYAIAFTILLGFSALGTEGVFVLFKQRQMESAASSAALAGATALMTGHPADYTVESRAVTATAGFKNGTAGVTVTVGTPKTGAYANNAAAVEVVISQPQTLPLSSIFYAGPWVVSARAVAAQGTGASDCVLQLDPAGSISLHDGGAVNLSGCGLAANAKGSPALAVFGGAALNASPVTVVGSTSVHDGGAINPASGVKTLQSPTADPYSNVSVPPANGLNYYGTSLNSGNYTLNPGVYYGGLSMQNGASVTMNPGVYIISGNAPGSAGFSVQGGAKLTGTGVTIVLTGNASNYAYLDIGNGVTVTLSAPTSGATAGLVVFQDPAAPTSGSNVFVGGSNLSLTGALYFPHQTVNLNNNTNFSAPCTQLVAWNIEIKGGAKFNGKCENTGVGTIGASPSVLVE